MKMGGGGSKLHDPVRDGENAAPTTPEWYPKDSKIPPSSATILEFVLFNTV